MLAGIPFSQAQIKLNSSGKFLVGSPYATQDLNNVLTASFFGPNGTCKSGAKLAFGDFGRMEYGGGNVFIGEYEEADTDQLWLHGKYGVYLTTGGSTIATQLSLMSNRATFLQAVYAPGYYLSSDSRFKSNVMALDDPLAHLIKLDGVKYDYNDKEKTDKYTLSYRDSAGGKDIPEGEELSEKEKASIKEEDLLANEKGNTESRTGFIAQDMQKIFPHLVKQDEAGYLAIDYTGLIPVIVEAIKEQQLIINAQSLKIKELESIINGGNGTENTTKSYAANGEENTELEHNAFLYANVPNPFYSTTEIKYFLPEGTRNAYLIIYNMRGESIKTMTLGGQGIGCVIIDGGQLAAGMYIYTLYINGKELDSKRMILTK